MRRPVFVLFFALFALVSCQPQPEISWWKGNLHTHSLWSDGDDYPEMIMAWYKTRGYHFVALSDHNTLAEGERWIDVARSAGGEAAYEAYRARFGAQVESRTVGDTLQARLKTLAEYRTLFEEPDRFLVVPSEEITDRFGRKPIHLNATNIQSYIAPQGGNSVAEVIQRNVDAVLAQREATGVPMFPHLNHPNFGWGVTVEDLLEVRGERFFEVYNGHPAVNNYGDELRPGLERMWDIILAERSVRGEPLLFGLAVDDAHHYHEMATPRSNPGRGWVMVQTPALTAEALVTAMEAGQFYASSGVTLHSIHFEEGTLALEIAAEPGVTYTTTFIGTRRGYENVSEVVPVSGARTHIRRRYSDEIGVVLAEVKEASASYTLQGDELYVRAKITSSKVKENPYQAGEVEVAWTQPVQ